MDETKIFKNLGTHGELIKDPDGAYTQLVHLQEGNSQAKDAHMEDTDKLDKSPDNMDNSIARSGSQRLSLWRSMSRGSSSGRSSVSLSFSVPFPIGIPATEMAGQDIERRDGEDEKRRKVSLRRLAYLNKPEVPVLLLGSIAAGIHGVIFPIFGLLLSTAIKIFFEPPNELKKDSRFWALMFVGLGVLTLMVVPVQNYFFGVAGGKLIQRIRSLSFEKVVHQEISWFDDPANSRWVYKKLMVKCLILLIV